MTYYIDMDGVIANFHKEPYNYSNAINREWIASLEPFVHNIDIIKNIIKAKHNVYILSKAASEEAKQGKIEWLHKYLPEINITNIIIIIGNGKKVDYIQEQGILVDDDMKNCRPWGKAGMTYIHLETKGQKIEL